MSLTARVLWIAREDGRSVRYRPGDLIPDDHPKRDWLIRHNIAEDSSAEPVEDAAEDVSDQETDEPVEDAAEAVSDQETDEPDEERPARAASVAAWRAYAETRGIDPKKMSKQELIAALS